MASSAAIRLITLPCSLAQLSEEAAAVHAATGNSDSYLRQPHRVMELHNDGTFVNQITDYVLMLKIDEKNMEGGNSLLLHLDDWEQCEEFFRHPMARREMRWTAPPSKKVAEDVFHSVFDTDGEGRPTMRYIDQFVQPENYEEGIWLNALSDSLEGSEKKVSVPVGVGSFLLINNLFWNPQHGPMATNPVDVVGHMAIFQPQLACRRVAHVGERLARIGASRMGHGDQDRQGHGSRRYVHVSRVSLGPQTRPFRSDRPAARRDEAIAVHRRLELRHEGRFSRNFGPGH